MLDSVLDVFSGTLPINKGFNEVVKNIVDLSIESEFPIFNKGIILLPNLNEEEK